MSRTLSGGLLTNSKWPTTLQSLIQGPNGRRFTLNHLRNCITGSRATQGSGGVYVEIPENEPMSVDEDEGEGDEIGPGCGILDIGIPELGCSKFWICKEYIRLDKYCDDYHLGFHHRTTWHW